MEYDMYEVNMEYDTYDVNKEIKAYIKQIGERFDSGEHIDDELLYLHDLSTIYDYEFENAFATIVAEVNELTKIVDRTVERAVIKPNYDA